MVSHVRNIPKCQRFGGKWRRKLQFPLVAAGPGTCMERGARLRALNASSATFFTRESLIHPSHLERSAS